ncbi:hypothetical protein A4A49_34336 [Nicotiana attenuata]|uniref:Reverse transcriptase/retrotransposon-derived protein RNase H-like domain-containing protein n=1 Tax=Nicotiana attenuata TaxID=49451 RepID=A0A1J6KMG1_NICAT|nr:hypothetical protein A4A49_34336 [Nicotiana attenuata]
MATEMNAVMNMPHKRETEVTQFCREAEPARSKSRAVLPHHEKAMSEMREVLNRVIHAGKRHERDKGLSYSGEELYSPNDKPFNLGELTILVIVGFNSLVATGMSSENLANVSPHVSGQTQISLPFASSVPTPASVQTQFSPNDLNGTMGYQTLRIKRFTKKGFTTFYDQIKVRTEETEAEVTEVLGEAHLGEDGESQLGEEPAEIQEVLDKYADVFSEPTQLPPSRGVFDHHIPLVEGAFPINSRPYRYSPLQKVVIEFMKGQPIAFISKGLSKQHQSLSVYEKELLALVLAYDFEIEYKKGKENKAADALSRLPLVKVDAMALSTMKTDLLELIMNSWELDDKLQTLIQSLKEKKDVAKGYTFIHEQLRKNERLAVGPNDQ